MTPRLVVIGASWGGLRAVSKLLSELPRAFPVPIVVVQHRAEDGGEMLASLLNRETYLRVRDAEDKQPLAAGMVHLAPPGYHLLIEHDHVALSTEGHVGFSRPSIDATLETAAATYGADVIGVVLTGNNEDGAAGLAEVRRRGGVAIVQDPATAERPRMPQAAADRAHPQVVTDLDGIARTLCELAPSEAGA